MRIFALLLLLASTPVLANELPDPQLNPDAYNVAIFEEKEGDPACHKLAIHIYHCKQYSCTTEQGIRHAIRGKTPDGIYCRHLQTLPGDKQVIDCQYSGPMQALIAKIQIQGDEFMTDMERALMSEAFERECQIKDLGEVTG